MGTGQKLSRVVLSICAIGAACLIGAGCARDGALLPRNPSGYRTPAADPVERVRARLPLLKPGMTEAQVKQVLSDLPLGEEAVVSRTISGGKTVRYEVAPHHHLELTFIPHSLNEPPPGPLCEASLTD